MTGERARFLTAAGAAFLLALGLHVAGSDAFARVLGPLPGPLAVAVATAIGAIAVIGIGRRLSLPVPNAAGLATVFGLGCLSALPMVGLDLVAPFAPGINVALPDALLFYPAIAVVAETFFHLVPLAALLAVVPARAPLWPVFLAVACVEPAYQAAFGDGAPRDLLMAAWLVAFGLFQLGAYRRHGVLALLATRLGYYLVWHILWGATRLPILFGAA